MDVGRVFVAGSSGRSACWDLEIQQSNVFHHGAESFRMLAKEVMDVLMHVDRNEFFVLPAQEICCESQHGMAVGDPIIADDEVCCERPPFQLWISLEKLEETLFRPSLGLGICQEGDGL